MPDSRGDMAQWCKACTIWSALGRAGIGDSREEECRGEKGHQGVSGCLRSQGKEKGGGKRKKNNKEKRKDQAKFVGSGDGNRGQRVTTQAPSSIRPHPLPPKPPHNNSGPGKGGCHYHSLLFFHQIQVYLL